MEDLKKKIFEETGTKAVEHSKSYAYRYFLWPPLLSVIVLTVYICNFFHIPLVIGGIVGFPIGILLCVLILRFLEKKKFVDFSSK